MKRGGFSLSSLNQKQAKSDTAAAAAAKSDPNAGNRRLQNPFLSQATNPEKAIEIFLIQSRANGRRIVESQTAPPVIEIEARLGILKSPYGAHDMRVTSSGAKVVGKHVSHAFLCNSDESANRAPFESGVTRSHFVNWTAAGLSEPSSISQAYGVRTAGAKSSSSESAQIKKDLVEAELIETVYGGYPNSRRVCFPGEHSNGSSQRGKMERKAKVATMDITLPAAHYDLRLMLATEQTEDANVLQPPPGWTSKRLKRRKSYNRRDRSFAWQLDVTEVSVEETGSADTNGGEVPPILYEIEIELSQSNALKLVNESDDATAKKHAKTLSQQLWWMLGQINPLSDVLEVDSYIREHPNREAVNLALAQCASLKRYNDTKEWSPAISASGPSPSPRPTRIKFIGCMPVNFSRHNIEEVQRCEKGYFLSEKTDGVRYLMVFTGSTMVLVDRAMKGNQPIPSPTSDSKKDPMAPVLSLIQPGTVLDGEVVIHRKLRRPMFIVFDVLCSGSKPVMHLPFEDRLRYSTQALFRTQNANRDMFSPGDVKNLAVSLPLVRKNFVRRTELDELLSHVVEERGMRSYKNGDLHNHLTDGIIFQPNRPYVVGTDHHLCKWKYLDTVTIDVEILPPKFQHNQVDQDQLRVGVLGEEGSMVDMTRYVKLPPSELLRLQADRAESGAKIAEVGFDPETGEWYYLTMRPDKIASNHISTVLGTLLELAESLGTNELRYRMSVRGGRDTYRKDVRSMQKQLLDFQRKKNNQSK